MLNNLFHHQYMLDLDMVKMLPRAYENFATSFKLPKILPGGEHCMMNSINVSNVTMLYSGA